MLPLTKTEHFMSVHKQNCLGFALEFWQREVEYKIWYNSDHAINIDINTQVMFKGSREFLPLETFGLEAVYNSHKANLNKDEVEILIEYYRRYSRESYNKFVTNPPNDFSFISPKSIKCKSKKEEPIEFSAFPVKFNKLNLQYIYVTLIGAEPYYVKCIEIDNENFKARFQWNSDSGGTGKDWYSLKDLKEYLRNAFPNQNKFIQK